MKILLEENLPRKLVAALRKEGHEVEMTVGSAVDLSAPRVVTQGPGRLLEAIHRRLPGSPVFGVRRFIQVVARLMKDERP